MSFELTLVCDGCSTVLNGGDRAQMEKEHREGGGRSFVSTLGAWTEVKIGEGERHLCWSCVHEGVQRFGDGASVPPPTRRGDG